MMLSYVGAFFLIIGIIMKLFPPRFINSIIGYRSRLSMKNKDTWDEAQKFGALTTIIIGAICVVLGLAIHYFFPANEDTIGIICLVIAVICDLVIDECHLRNIFDENGIRRAM